MELIAAGGGEHSERFAPHKAFLSGLLGGCLYSAWNFQRNRKQLSGLGPRALLAGVACSAFSGSYSWYQAQQAQRHANALERLQRTREAIHLVPIGSDSPPVPSDEFDEATGENAVERNAELLRQIRLEDKVRRRSEKQK
ncbi:unnamed protein product [Polarella glacialis]|uniref:Uncharacterized protein n=1 Tax=Polarella glacialis TaxID=89957 RepID=A0A813GKF8_POLGL|nr:unnamed protein product [Polarella glacialis]